MSQVQGRGVRAHHSRCQLSVQVAGDGVGVSGRAELGVPPRYGVDGAVIGRIRTTAESPRGSPGRVASGRRMQS